MGCHCYNHSVHSQCGKQTALKGPVGSISPCEAKPRAGMVWTELKELLLPPGACSRSTVGLCKEALCSEAVFLPWRPPFTSLHGWGSQLCQAQGFTKLLPLPNASTMTGTTPWR